MWKCHKCGKPVYFAERQQSLGYNWHPECLRCEECGKRLNPGQHAEHKGVPYCHVPCYGALFGPQLFGHGTRVESHKSFGPLRDSPKPALPRSHLESKLKLYNQFFEKKSGEIRSREVNGRLILEGPVRIHWGVQGVIHLKENDDQRTVVTIRKRNSCRLSSSNVDGNNSDTDDVESISRDTSYSDVSSLQDTDQDTSRSDTGIESGSSTEVSTAENSPVRYIRENLPKSVTLPSKLDRKSMEWDELDDLLQVERKVDEVNRQYQTMPAPLPSQSSLDSDNSGSLKESDSTPTLSAKNGLSVSTLNVTLSENADSETINTMTLTPNNKESSTPLATQTENIDVSVLKPTENGVHDISVNSEASSEMSRSVQSEISESVTSELPKDDDSWYYNSNNYLNRSMSHPDCRHSYADSTCTETSESQEVIARRPHKGSTAIKRRPGKRLSRSKVKRRCSINGHFYDRETSFFTPPHGSQMSVWVTSLATAQDVVNLLLEKYKVESDPNNFALFIVRDNGEQKRLKDDESPLVARVLCGPHEDVSKLFLVDSHKTQEVSSEVAQFLNLSLAECRAILNQYYSQEEREVAQVRQKYNEIKRRMLLRIEDLRTAGT